MIFLRLLSLAVAITLATACQVPLTSAKTPSRGVTLNFVISGAGPAPLQRTTARLLLPTVSTLSVTLTPQAPGSPVVTATVSIPSGASVVPVSFSQVSSGVCTVFAQAFDAAGTVQFQQTATLTFGAAQNSATLNLVPAFSSNANQLASGQNVSGTIPAGTALSWNVPPSSLVGGGWGLTLMTSSSVLLFAQDSGGASFPASDTMGIVTNVRVKDGGTSYITLYNPTTTDQGFEFVLGAPTVAFTVNSQTPYFTAAFAAGSTTVIYFDLTDSLSVSYSLPAAGSGLTFGYVNQNGTPLTGIATANSATVLKSALGMGATGLYMTVTNTTAGNLAAPGNREYISFALDPSKVTAFALALDTGVTPNRIDVFSLNESTGVVALSSQISLPTGFTASRLILDPGKPRFYVTGNSGSYALDGYTISTAGVLKEIAGFPETGLANTTMVPPVITTEHNLYWTDAASALDWVSIAADGTLAAGSPLSWGTSANPTVSLAYTPANNLLVLGTMSGTLTAYQPLATGGATALTATFSGSAPNSHSPLTFVDPVLSTIFQTFNSYFYIFSTNAGSSPVTINTVSKTTPMPNVGPAVDATGLTLYLSPNATVAPYTVAAYSISSSTDAITATGTTWTVPSSASAKVIANDPAGTCVLVGDSLGNLYSLTSGTLTQIASVAVTSGVFTDLAVVRVQ